MSEFLDDIKSFFGTGSTLATEGPKPVPEQWKDDPVAQKTDWGPNEKGGINFQTHKLVESGGSSSYYDTRPFTRNHHQKRFLGAELHTNGLNL